MKEINNKEYVRIYQGVLDYLTKNYDTSQPEMWKKCFEGLIPEPENPLERNRHSCVRRHTLKHLKKSDYQNAILEIIAYKYSRDTDLKLWYKPKRSIEVLQGVLYLIKKRGE